MRLTLGRVGCILALLAAWPSGGLAASLPEQAAGIRIGEPWRPDDPRFAGATELSFAVSPWDRLARKCGYLMVRLESPGAELLVEVEDATVTRLVHRTPLPAARSPLEHAESLIAAYGPPATVSLRDAQGSVTSEHERAAFVTLDYEAPNPVRFTLSGAPARSQTTVIQYQERRWHQNKMMRCTRVGGG